MARRPFILPTNSAGLKSHWNNKDYNIPGYKYVRNATNSNYLLPYLFNLTVYTLRLIDLTEFIVWNILGLHQ